jgi:indole-3-glycerol phosphate synthase
MPDFLESMAIASRERAAAAKLRVPTVELRKRIADLPDPPRLASSPGSFDLIAEVKRRSPSVGPLGGGQVEQRARSYAAAGAAAISVLTEPVAFGGSLEDLRRISDAVGNGGAGGSAEPIPTLRKDFITDPYQLLEARASGAGGALLVLRLLTDEQVAGMIAAAAEARLFLLFEAFDGDELGRARNAARSAGAVGVEALVGLNCRDLRSLEVRPGRFRELAHAFPDDVRRVAESGIQDADDAAEVAGWGFDLALVGTALMKQSDPESLIATMLEAGRAARFGA